MQSTSRSSTSTRASHLLATATDSSLSLTERADAVAELGKLREKTVTDRLAGLLLDHLGADILTYELIIALDNIGDPRALPALLKLWENPPHKFPGRINTALSDAIEHLRAIQNQEASIRSSRPMQKPRPTQLLLAKEQTRVRNTYPSRRGPE